MTMHFVQRKNLVFFIGFLFFSIPLFASTTHDFPFPPRLSLGASIGNTTFGEGDAMIPIWGNPGHLFHGDVKVKYGNDSAWLASLGLGGRKIYRCDSILGGYLFVDYNRTCDNSRFLVLNPGVEFMTDFWDGHLNGYFPISRDQEILHVYTGTQLGIPNTIFIFNMIETVGPGADFELGYYFNQFAFVNRGRVFAGGYYFSPQHNSDIRGIELGYEMFLNHLWTLELRGSYDNTNRSALLMTLRLTLGSRQICGFPDIHDRILDRIPRNLGVLYTGDGIPSKTRFIQARTKVI